MFEQSKVNPDEVASVTIGTTVSEILQISSFFSVSSISPKTRVSKNEMQFLVLFALRSVKFDVDQKLHILEKLRDIFLRRQVDPHMLTSESSTSSTQSSNATPAVLPKSL